MSVPPEIYLDMDGVCVDFIGAAMKTQGYDADQMLKGGGTNILDRSTLNH